MVLLCLCRHFRRWMRVGVHHGELCEVRGEKLRDLGPQCACADLSKCQYVTGRHARTAMSICLLFG
jgi:hypothetical protein